MTDARPRPAGSLPVVREPVSTLQRASEPGLGRGALGAARAIAEAMFATDAGPPSSERLDYLEAELSDFFFFTSLRARVLFTISMRALDWLGPPLMGRLPGLARLSLEDRVEALLRVERSPLSLAFLAAKAMLSILYYEQPDAAEEIGWDQRCLEEGDER